METKMDELKDERKHLQNKIRRASPEEKERLRAEKSEITKKIASCRRHLKTNYAIEERAEKIQSTMDLIVANEAKALCKTVDKPPRADNEPVIRRQEREYER